MLLQFGVPAGDATLPTLLTVVIVRAVLAVALGYAVFRDASRWQRDYAGVWLLAVGAGIVVFVPAGLLVLVVYLSFGVVGPHIRTGRGEGVR